MVEEIEDEILLLESVFCKPGEFSKDINSKSNEYILSLNTSDNSNNYLIVCQITMVSGGLKWNSSSLENKISFRCVRGDVERKTLSSFKEACLQHIKHLIENDSIKLFDVFSWVSQELPLFLKDQHKNRITSDDQSSVSTKPIPQSYQTALIKLDHIRSRKRYFKFLQNWSKSLNLTAKLLESQRLIILLIIGTSEDDVRNFIKALKTSLVDIDSNGCPCKEKMAEILERTTIMLEKNTDIVLGSFNEMKFSNLTEIEEYIASFNLKTKCT